MCRIDIKNMCFASNFSFVWEFLHQFDFFFVSDYEAKENKKETSLNKEMFKAQHIRYTEVKTVEASVSAHFRETFGHLRRPSGNRKSVCLLLELAARVNDSCKSRIQTRFC